MTDSDIGRSHVLHFRNCNCLAYADECCRENCPCHERAEGTISDGQSQPEESERTPQPATDAIGPE